MDNKAIRRVRIKEVALRLGVTRNTAKRLILNLDDPNVLHLTNAGTGTGKRPYDCLLIPESTIVRLEESLRHDALKLRVASGRPPRIISLRSLYAGVPQESRNIPKGNSPQKHIDGKGVA